MSPFGLVKGAKDCACVASCLHFIPSSTAAEVEFASVMGCYLAYDLDLLCTASTCSATSGDYFWSRFFDMWRFLATAATSAANYRSTVTRVSVSSNCSRL